MPLTHVMLFDLAAILHVQNYSSELIAVSDLQMVEPSQKQSLLNNKQWFGFLYLKGSTTQETLDEMKLQIIAHAKFQLNQTTKSGTGALTIELPS